MESVDGARFVLRASDEIHHCDICKYDDQEKTATKFCRDCKEFICQGCAEQHKEFVRQHSVTRIGHKYPEDHMDRNHCDVCKYDGQEKTATKFCYDCNEFLCQGCVKEHKEFVRQHEFIPIDHMYRHIYHMPRDEISCIVFCENCHNAEVSDYCEQHQAVTCQICKIVGHSKCNCVSVKERSQSYYENEKILDQAARKANAVVNKIAQLHSERNYDLRSLSSLKQTCTEETKTYTENVRKLLDCLEETFLSELNKCATQDHQEIERQMSVLSATKQLLQNDSKFLEDVKEYGRPEHMFVAGMKVSSRVKEYELLLHDISLERKIPLRAFTKNEQLKILKTETKGLEILLDGFIKGSKSTVALLTNIKLQNTILVSVKRRDDENTPLITGCDCTHDGKIILCDSGNNKVKLLHSSFALNESLDSNSMPWDVSLINRFHAVVTFPDSRELRWIELEPTLNYYRFERGIQLDKKVWGIKGVFEDIYITLSDDKGECEIRVLNFTGVCTRTIAINQNSIMLRTPYYLTADITSGRLYCSDFHTNTVTCLKLDGSLVYQYSDIDLKSPGGMCVDAMGNLIICSKGSDRLQIITPSGKKSPAQLSADIKLPVSLAYRPIDKALIIGCSETSNLAVLYLTH